MWGEEVRGRNCSSVLSVQRKVGPPVFFLFCLFVIVGELNETEKVELLVNLHLILATGAMIIPTAMVYLSFTKPVLVHVLLKQAPSAPWETSATKWSGTGNPHSMAPSAWGY